MSGTLYQIEDFHFIENIGSNRKYFFKNNVIKILKNCFKDQGGAICFIKDPFIDTINNL